MTIEVLRPGLLSSLQDLGRYGYQRFGVVPDGAMDDESHRIANFVVGNAAGEATLECTLQGPVLLFHAPALIGIAGADMAPRIDGEPVPAGRPVMLRKGARLEFGACRAGCRTYLAVGGGFRVPEVLGSRSTYLRGSMGGYLGRALRKGDHVEVGSGNTDWFPSLRDRLAQSGRVFVAPKWGVSLLASALARKPGVVRAMPGRDWALFSREVQRIFGATEFQVALDSDRMGYRLECPDATAIHPKKQAEMISEAISFGTIQVPHDGRPIVLLADRQTTGGYPKIADVASVDLPVMAQLQPRNRLRFELIDLDSAQRLWLTREQELTQIRQAVAFRKGL